MKNAEIDEGRTSIQHTPLVQPCAEEQSQPQGQNRRELIKRYGKYALAAGPLLLFVSKAHAIHSRP
jgi:hypothetical protein